MMSAYTRVSAEIHRFIFYKQKTFLLSGKSFSNGAGIRVQGHKQNQKSGSQQANAERKRYQTPTVTPFGSVTQKTQNNHKQPRVADNVHNPSHRGDRGIS
ncbi:MAG: hypothetical protein V7754_20110 [Halioglobus sp.]